MGGSTLAPAKDRKGKKRIRGAKEKRLFKRNARELGGRIACQVGRTEEKNQNGHNHSPGERKVVGI